MAEQTDSGARGTRGAKRGSEPTVELMRLEWLESPQISRAAAVLARAFQYDPMMAYLIPDERRRATAAPGFFRDIVNYCLRYGEVYTTPEVEGVACWLPPGETKVSTGRLLRTGGLWTPLTLGPVPFSRLIAMTIHHDGEQERNAPDPHWYLYILGAEPLSRGRGIGRALLRPLLEQADAAGQPCYLETQNERNVPVYEGLGFRLTSESEVPGRGLKTWTMRRESAQA